MTAHPVSAPQGGGTKVGTTTGSGRRPAARIVGVLLLLWGTLIAVAAPASAGIGYGVTPTFPSNVIVGQTGLPASLQIVNASTPPENAGTITLSAITLVPSCGTNLAAGDCPAAFIDPGVFALSPTGVGEAGTQCAGFTFTITLIDPVQGKYSLTPSSTVILGPPGSLTDTCRIDFTFNVLKAPTKDAAASAGIQTAQLAAVAGTASVNGNFAPGFGLSIVTVALASPTIATTASAPVVVGGTISDSAILAGGAGPGGPTGTITFQVFGPGDTACATPLTPPLPPVTVAGNGTYPSGNFTTTAVGTYRFIASYSGDANNNPVTSTCADPAEAVAVRQATPTIVTTASGSNTIGGNISDTATVSGGFSPTGTVTFSVFSDAACTVAAFPARTVPLVLPTTSSGNFGPTTAAGTYYFVATYSGDANNVSVTSPCGAPGEQVSVKTSPTLATTASGSVPVGGNISDTAVLTNAFNPTGTMTFSVFSDAACTVAAFPARTVPVTGATTLSGPFGPVTTAGTYHFIASYSGDANNNAAGPTACADPAEAVVVTRATPTLATTASGSVPVGSNISDTAVLTNAFNPTGTMTFSVFSDAACTVAAFPARTVPVTGATTLSGPFGPVLTAGTYHFIASYSGDANNTAAGPTACADPAEAVVVTRVTPGLTTNASASVNIGGQIHDTANLTGGSAPTGTITFNLYGPNDATCTGAVIFTNTVPVAGAGAYDSANFTPTAAGVYRWVASYSGDANNTAVGPTACSDPAEAVTVGRASPQIVTNASAPVLAGGTIHDTATLSGGTTAPAITGTITFSLYGPDNATCAPPAAFTATVPVSGNGNYDSPNFTANLAGVYRWVATYSGDVNNNAAGPTACADPAEQVTVTKANPLIATNASGSVPIGGAISDTATLTGGVLPTGTITFTLFGPNNATCTGTPIFTATVAVTGNGTYPSGPFTPSQAGTYRWVASYSGDATNNPATTVCLDPTEAVVVTPLTPSITTTASPTVNLGGQIRDTATLTGGSSPTGTITFNLYGPNDTTCAGTIAFTSTVPVAGAGAYQSGTFTPTAPGVYRWIARYGGDVNNGPAGPTACLDPAEQVLVRPNPTLTTTASASVPEGGAISDTATLAGGITPTGTITFNLFGPNNATCVGTPIFTSTATVSGNGVYPSGTFTTAVNGPSGPGTYRWVASYSGDANNAAAGPTPCSDPAEQVVVTNVAPAIRITKTPNPTTKPEPGGTFTFTLVVTNPSPEPVTITSLIDDKYGDVNGKGNCAVGAVLAPNGGTYQCAFPGDFFGAAPASQTDTVVVTGIDNEGATVTAQAQAVVTLTNVPPSITVVKTASPASRPEPGGTFTFTVVVTNTSIKPVRLTDLVDDIYGDLAGKGTCAVGAILAANGGTYSCTFPGNFTGVGGQTQTDIVTATAVDNAGNRVMARDDAIVAITSVLPSITVEKSVLPVSLQEPGGTFTFKVVVNNTSGEELTLTTLVDDKYGDLNGRGTCSVPQTLAVGGSYTCTFPGDFTGLSGDTQTDTVTGTAVDSRGRQATANARATVLLTGIPPTITVVKVADPLSKPEPGGNFTFTVTVTNTSFKQVTLTTLTDDVYGDLNGQGTCKTGPTIVLAANGGTYTCSFTGAFTGVGGASQTDTVTAVVVDNRGNTATAKAQATVTLTNVPPTIVVTKTPDPTTRPAPGGSFSFTVTVKNTTVQPLTLTALTDDVYGDLNGKGDCKTGGVIAPGATYTCTFTGNFTGKSGDQQTDTVTATAKNPRNQSVTATAKATVSLTPTPTTPTPPPIVQVRTGVLARTGFGLGGPARLAMAMMVLGALLLAATFRGSWRPALAVPETVTSALDTVRRRWTQRTGKRLRSRLMGEQGRVRLPGSRRSSQPRWQGSVVRSPRSHRSTPTWRGRR